MNDDEESQLRVAAFENSQAIFLARQRAEAELVRTTEALERKSQELEHSLALSRATLESTSDGILVTDAAGGVTAFNANFVRMWHVPDECLQSREHERVLQFTASQTTDPVATRARVREIYATSPPDSYDLIELADGRAFERVSRPQCVGETVVGRVWSFRDITESRRIEQELRQQAERWRVTVSSIGDGVVTTDTQGTVQSMNRVAETLTGWTQEQALGRPLADVFRIVDVETRQPVVNPVHGALREGRVVTLGHDVLLLALDGTETPIDDSAAPIRDGEEQILGAVLVFHGIAERKAAERALRHSADELAEFFENATVGLHWVGAHGTILRANRAELEMLGYRENEYVGHHIAEFHVDPERIDHILRQLNSGEELRGVETRMRCKDGSIRHVLLDSNVRWENGVFAHSRCFTRDITDRKRVQDVQRRLASIVESSHDSIVGTVADHVVSWNAGAEKLYGYPPEAALGRHITFCIPPDKLDEERTTMARLSAGERLEHFETVRVTRDGSRIEVSLAVSPIMDDEGRVIGTSRIARDITERKNIEQALRASEAQFRHLADGLPQIVWTARPDGSIDYYNKRWTEFSGFSTDETTESTWGLLLHPDDQLRCADTYTACIRSGDLYQLEHRWKDYRTGRYRWFLGRAYPVRDEQGDIVRWFGTCTDIDDTKHAAETTQFLADASAALAELTDERSTLFRVAALAVPRFADWCAVDNRDPGGEIDRAAVTQEDLEKAALVRDLVLCQLPGESADPAQIHVLRGSDSSWVELVPATFVVNPVRDDEQSRLASELGLNSFICVPLLSRGQPVGLMTFATAESGRVYDSRDLAAAEDLAQRTVLAIENARFLVALKDSDRRKDEFLAMLAHELRNPLAPIQYASGIIRSSVAPEPELQWASDVLDRQVFHMTRLVDDLLDVSRITRGVIELRKERTDLVAVVNSSVEATRPLMEKRGHALTIMLSTDPVPLEADLTRLAQVFTNLLTNAAKYTDPGGRISLAAEIQGDHVSVLVTDSGIGITPELLPHIFEMFTQADRSLERSEGGLGIGLTLVKQLVEMHGGSVEARSDGVGAGSQFVVRLPVAAKRQAAVAAGAVSVSRVGESPTLLRILVVDDNRDAALSLAMLLRRLHHDVITAYDGLEAVAAAAEYRPDVVLLDIGLPKLNGRDAARRIKALSDAAGPVLIAVTGWGQAADRRLTQEAQFDHHLTKPVAFDTLQRLLADVKPLGRL